MSASLTSEPESVFVCDCEEQMRSACAGQPFYKEHEGKRYCVLHFPGKEKSADFQRVFMQKVATADFNFMGLWFPDALVFDDFNFPTEASFCFATFCAKVSFDSASFNAMADFRDTRFEAEANFFEVTFKGFAYFKGASFGADAVFTGAVFAGRVFFKHAIFYGQTYFTSALFSDRTYFNQTIICAEAYFTYSSFQSYALFSGSDDKPVFGNEALLDFQFARIEKPERVSFHTLTLRPNWFVNIDTRRLDFVNVEWDWRKIGIDKEVETLKSRRISSPHGLLAVACRHLAVNAEENHRYEEASKFRYMAMDARRQEHWRGFAFWKLSWWYWLASGYGERVLKAFLVLLGILLLSAVLYTQVGFARWEPKLASESDVASAKRDDVGAPLKFGRALTYSAAVMTFQRPEPRPATPAAQIVVLLETILGPVQAALLALAIRRKFMR